MPIESQTMGERMIRKVQGLLHLPETTNAQRRQALRELLEWTSETLDEEARWDRALHKRRILRAAAPPTTTEPQR